MDASPDALGVLKTLSDKGPEDGDSAAHILFQSANVRDATADSAFGFKVAWINRFSQAPRNCPAKPDVELRTLDDLPPLLEN